MALVPQEMRVWSRVRLDRERTDLDPDDLAYALNVDLFLEPGTIRGRRGTAKIYTSALGNLKVRKLAKVAGIRYQVAGQSLYRASTSILSTLSSRLVTAIQPYRPLNDTTTWAFVADSAAMYKDDGTNLRVWGLTAPAAAPTSGLGAGALTGVFSVKYTYVRKVGSAVIAESNPSPVSNNQTLAGQSITAAVLASSDAQVTHIRLYRTTAGGASWLYDQEAANANATLTSTQADSALGAAVGVDNDAPPACGFVSPPYLDRLWLCGDPSFPHYLYYTKRFQPEAVPTANYLELGTPDDPLQCFVPFGGVGITFAQQRKYRVIGTGTSSFLPHDTPGKRGTLSPDCAVAGEDGVYFAAKDGVFRTTGFSADEQLAGPILPLFNGESKNGYDPINLNQGTACSIAIWKGRLYFACPTGISTTADTIWVHRLGTTQWEPYAKCVASLFLETDTDALLAGGYDGYVRQIETGESDDGGNITWIAETKDYAHVAPESPAGATERKLYYGTKDDVEPDGAAISAGFYVDGTLVRTESLAVIRRPTLKRLPDTAQGYRWRKRWTYTGTGTAKVYGTNVLAQPLKA